MFKNNDIASAKIFASMSQRLCPELEGISQLCAMLDVLDSSEQRINGHANWYGVLSVDPTADDATIKKQFNRLALMLQPDKKRSVEAKDAFELVSEAKDILLDKQRRSDYDRASEREPRRTPVAHRPHRLPDHSGRAYAYGRGPPLAVHRGTLLAHLTPSTMATPVAHRLIRATHAPRLAGHRRILVVRRPALAVSPHHPSGSRNSYLRAGRKLRRPRVSPIRPARQQRISGPLATGVGFNLSYTVV
ncbi:Dnaj homolog subfamily b member 8 [Phtheirospermum japonicum]|uniref:Dnaj homolog subfamily b member 8 n=1 Tax=Phtheirospermum japonicum TaxID=374723 RepID=A0A830C4X4_9LAMI|nr:Dnaj homolog subfamily b member 8 [Phtheirospermum japonicum]